MYKYWGGAIAVEETPVEWDIKRVRVNQSEERRRAFPHLIRLCLAVVAERGHRGQRCLESHQR